MTRHIAPTAQWTEENPTTPTLLPGYLVLDSGVYTVNTTGPASTARFMADESGAIRIGIPVTFSIVADLIVFNDDSAPGKLVEDDDGAVIAVLATDSRPAVAQFAEDESGAYRVWGLDKRIAMSGGAAVIY